MSDTVTIKITIELLAKRIGSKNPKSIQNKKSSASEAEFSEWTAKKDLDGISWKALKDGKRVCFVPATELSTEIREKLQNWLNLENSASLSEGEAEAQTNHPQGLAF